jgi:glycosyltransferase involved in cell wall biosynthesis
MDKKIVVIASVLKPVNDSRNYEKTAISITRSGNYQVHLVGQKVQKLPLDDSVHFVPLFSFHRLSIQRFFTNWIFLFYLFRTKPDLVIVTTFELLAPAILYKIIRRKKLIYDVQENYFRNLIYTNSFPPVIKQILAIGVRGWEYFTRPFVNHYFLAEKNYGKEFSFAKNKSTVLENKTRKESVKPRESRQEDIVQLLYSGTISENYGVFEAVDLVKELYKLDAKIRLKIVGFAPQKKVLEKLKLQLAGLDFITLVGGNSFVSHEEILNFIAESDFGLISYRSDKSTENCIPTKFYEYLAHRLPYLISSNPLWLGITAQYRAGIETNFLKPDIEIILNKMKENKFYTNEPGEEIFWNEDLLILTIEKII